MMTMPLTSYRTFASGGILIVLFLSICLFASPSIAQTVIQNREGTIIINAKTLPPDAQERMALARRLISSKNFATASAILEELYIQYPDNETVVNLLRTCYMSAQLFGKAEMLSRRMVATYPENIGFRMNLAESLAKQNKLDDARAEYDAVSRLIPSSDASRCEVLLSSMMESEMYDDLILYTDKLRQSTQRADACAFYRGMAFEKKRDYAFATAEYLLSLDDSLRTGGQAEARLMSLLDFPDASAETEKVLLRDLSRTSNIRGLRILSSWYLKRDKFEKAFEMALWQDSVSTDGSGSHLHYFMQSCLERKLFRHAIRIARHIRKDHPLSPLVMESWYAEANALAELGRTDSASACFDSAYAMAPRLEQQSEALYRHGMMILTTQADYPRSLKLFDSVARSQPAGMSYVYTRTVIPKCLIGIGSYQSALASCDSVLVMRLPDDLKEEVSYYRVMSRLAMREIDSATVGLKKLTIDFPRGIYVNDAIHIMTVLGKASDDPHILEQYTSAILYRFRQKLDSAALELAAIAAADNASVADVATWELAEMNFIKHDSATALTLAVEFERRFPDSYYLLFAKKLHADITGGSPQGADSARKMYREILEQFPNHPLAAEVRRKLKELDEKTHIG